MKLFASSNLFFSSTVTLNNVLKGFSITHRKSTSLCFLNFGKGPSRKTPGFTTASGHLLQTTHLVSEEEGLTSNSPSVIEFGPKVACRPFQKAALKYFNRDLLMLAKKSSATIKNNESRFAKEAYDILLQALFASDEDRLRLELPIPTSMSFGVVLDALSTSGLSEAPLYAETLITYMEQMSESGYKDCSPNLICYNSALTCWARASHPEAGMHADALLSRMQKFVRPDRISYTNAIRAWANTCNSNQRRALKEPISVAQRAEDKLLKMEHMYFEQGIEEMRPDEYTYSTVIDAVGKSGEVGAAQRAEAILRRMEKFYESGKTQVSPTHVTYTAVIDAYAKQCSASSSVADAEAAEALLQQMEGACATEGTSNSSIRPNKISYTAVIDAWGKCREEGSAKRAEAVLHRMQQKYEEGDETVRPNAITYAVVINAYAKSNESTDKAQKAFDVLNRMHALYRTTRDPSFQPNTVAYTSCLNACAFTSTLEERPLALSLLQQTMEELENSPYCKPNHRSYATFLRGLSNLMPAGDERDAISKATFENCCERGEVDYIVLENLRFASDNVYTQQLGPLSKAPVKALMLHDLPPEWSRNVANPLRRGWNLFRSTSSKATSALSSQASQVLNNNNIEDQEEDPEELVRKII